MMDYLIRQVVMAVLAPLWRPFTGSIHAIQDRFRGIGTSEWQMAPGRIHSRHVSSDQDSWKVRVVYSYCAEGEYWSGEFRRAFAAKEDAESYEALHPSESPLAVRYCPSHPEKSVVLAKDQKTVSQVGTI